MTSGAGPGSGSGSGSGDEIAVVGMAGRFPGAPDVASLWRNLLDGVDSVHDHTDDELRAFGLAEELITAPDLVRGHGRLAGAADFDAEFFGVSDAEALRMDPQQRLFLEQAWLALEDAGYGGPSDAAVGVFAGSSANRYFLFRVLPSAGAAGYDWEGRLGPAGWAPDYLPAQVAYRLGLTGPAIAVQTACSSSLTAVCTAAQNLLDYRCDLALAGGVSVTEPRFRHEPGGLVSPDGRCRAFDAAGQGSGYGSGAVVLVLRRLADALADGDQVHAVLRGWAVNNDGAVRAGFAAPGVDGQAAVVAEALAVAEVSASELGFVEAHGSGTAVGDAIEVDALTRAFRASGGAGPAGSCLLGSVRTNLGNLDAAAGATALVKAVLAVRDGLVPPNLHFDTPNPAIDFAGTPFTVPVKTSDWPDGHERRLAGVSSFGLGGTNAHVIVEQPPPVPPRPPAGPVTLPLSARTPDDLRLLAARLRDRLATDPALRLDDVAHTLAVGRRVFPVTATVAAPDRATALAGLTALAEGAEPAGDVTGRCNGAGSDAPAGDGDGLAEVRGNSAAGDGVDAGVERGDAAASGWAAAVEGARRVSLPGYPLRGRRYWIEAPR